MVPTFFVFFTLPWFSFSGDTIRLWISEGSCFEAEFLDDYFLQPGTRKRFRVHFSEYQIHLLCATRSRFPVYFFFQHFCFVVPCSGREPIRRPRKMMVWRDVYPGCWPRRCARTNAARTRSSTPPHDSIAPAIIASKSSHGRVFTFF